MRELIFIMEEFIMKKINVKEFCKTHKGAIVKGAAAVGTFAVVTFLVTMGLKKKAEHIYHIDEVVVYD